ncbi:uncharacterized protein B0I36DRAFT_433917 [Microdochium trichocladiopsis]|uniref:Cyanovirin-N domain-containing protein n=1 Tax=Microdochium trichocladiopsis TaxID=1682393 RepID=A0A9P8Y1T1_9PEZI|nr:uncharacterized protein B0I36DRAFT_433917 [Microdochium trichocladiopsis]KAH7026491.1 hypothetical protein B0I36DRAFT_433917 [Microdochium trichocladiopsis]
MLLALIASLAVPAFVAAQGSGGFMTNCTWQGAQFDTQRGLLAMYCNNDDWAAYDYDWATLDTNLCFINNGGKLSAVEEGGYFDTCDLCDVDKGVTKTEFMLTCHCWSSDGVFKESSVDLRTLKATDLMSNHVGQLEPWHGQEFDQTCSLPANARLWI